MKRRKVLIVCNSVKDTYKIHFFLINKLIRSIKDIELVELNVNRFYKKNSNYDFNYKGGIYSVTKIYSIKSLYALLSEDTVVVCFFSETSFTYLITRILIKLRSSYLIYIFNLGTSFSFSFDVDSNDLRVFSKIKNNIYSAIKKTKRYAMPFVLLILTKLSVVNKIDVLYVSDSKYRKTSRFSREKYKSIVEINSLNYDLYLENKYMESSNYIVFLDSMLPYHGDQIRYGYTPINRNLYYTNLNNLFDRIEAAINKEVVVCLHPKYNEKNKRVDFGKRKAIKNMSQFYVSQSDIVLFHESSSINSAFIYNKKVVQLFSIEFNNFVINLCDQYKKKTGVFRFDFFDDNIEELLLYFNEKDKPNSSQKEFVDRYIISSGKENILGCDQIVESLNYKFKI